MNPKTAFLSSIVVALILPAVAAPAMGAAFYTPPECREVPPDVPERCPGVSVGDPLAAPDGECIDPTTSFVYRCSDTASVIGVGVPSAYTYARARSAMTDYECSAQTIDTPHQWCVQFSVAMIAFEALDDELGGKVQARLRVETWINDNCDRLNPTAYYSKEDFDGPAVWNHVLTGVSKCEYPFGLITATVKVTDRSTGQVLHTSESQAMYGPPGYYWVGLGSPCNPWVHRAGYGCRLYYNGPDN